MLNFYSNVILRQMEGFPLTPTQGTYFVGVSGFTGAILCPFIFPHMSRKGNLMYGHATMGIDMMLIGLFAIFKIYVPLFVCICLFCVFFQTS